MSPPDERAAEQAIEQFLRALGHEASGDMADTPRLVAQSWSRDLLDGYAVDPGEELRQGAVDLGSEHPGLVVLRNLTTTTMCPHHLLPAHGRATIGYLPRSKVAGFGAIAKALRARTRRLTFQEQAGEEMAALLVEHLDARGAFCQLHLMHGCLVARGTREADAVVESIALAGSFTEPGPDRDLALTALAGAQIAPATSPCSKQAL
ncbi:MAG: GTP cyclohydrolase I [Deltaproteobacteria bacterium]|jgi:GTP cyclohydrolase I|nr:GTP cyclohydrolase I [Deltaproteobacteria bacterium]MBW2531047.1 GTP cyclohydrolase I [Deltaproteobacteria bacterium]